MDWDGNYYKQNEKKATTETGKLIYETTKQDKRVNTVKTEKTSGESAHPWGAPVLIVQVQKEVFSSPTCCVLSVRSYFMYLMTTDVRAVTGDMFLNTNTATIYQGFHSSGLCPEMFSSFRGHKKCNQGYTRHSCVSPS